MILRGTMVSVSYEESSGSDVVVEEVELVDLVVLSPFATRPLGFVARSVSGFSPRSLSRPRVSSPSFSYPRRAGS
jgi:hypothetical protein